VILSAIVPIGRNVKLDIKASGVWKDGVARWASAEVTDESG
jgi:hypothetical protein